MKRPKLTSDDLLARAEGIHKQGPVYHHDVEINRLRHDLLGIGAALVDALGGVSEELALIRRAIQNVGDR